MRRPAGVSGAWSPGAAVEAGLLVGWDWRRRAAYEVLAQAVGVEQPGRYSGGRGDGCRGDRGARGLEGVDGSEGAAAFVGAVGGSGGA